MKCMIIWNPFNRRIVVSNFILQWYYVEIHWKLEICPFYLSRTPQIGQCSWNETYQYGKLKNDCRYMHKIGIMISLKLKIAEMRWVYSEDLPLLLSVIIAFFIIFCTHLLCNFNIHVFSMGVLLKRNVPITMFSLK